MENSANRLIKKILVGIAATAIMLPSLAVAARTSIEWVNLSGTTYIQPNFPTGIDILIYGSNHYVNFNTVTGSSGYGIRDNAGTIEFKNSGGSWAGIGSGGGSAWPFTPATNFGVAVQSTTTPLSLTNGIFASSTSRFVNASTTLLTVGSGTFIQGAATSTFGAGIAGTYLNLTGATASSSAANGIDLSAGCFSISGTCLQTFIQNATAYKQAVNYATAAVLSGTPTYSNGVAGVGATLTEIGLGALTVDGQAVSAGQRLLVKNEVDQTTNGVYVVTNAGSGIANYILTRATDYDEKTDVYAGTTIPVLAGGTANADTQWTETTTGTIVMGTSNIAFEETALGTNVPTSVANSDGTLTISPTTGAVVASIALAHPNWWIGLQNFKNATTSQFTATSSVWLTNYTNAVLSVDANGLVVASSSIGTNFITGALATINGTVVARGDTATIAAASSTLLANNNTWTGKNIFAAATSTAFAITSLPSSLLSTDSNGNIFGTTSVGTNFLAGKILATNFPVLTGDVTTAGGSLATTLASSSIGSNYITGALGTIATTFPLTGGATLTRGGTVTIVNAFGTTTDTGMPRNMLVTVNNSGVLVSSSTPTMDSFFATSTTATSTISGNLMIDQNGGSSLYPNSPLGIFGTSTGTLQFTVRNTAASATSSTDIIVSNNKSTNTSYYGDFGINDSVNTDILYTGFAANDVYLYSNDSRLDLASATTSSAGGISLFTNGTLAANQVMALLNSARIVMGTTTAQLGLLNIGTTSPQLVLSDNNGADFPWTLRSINSNFYLATSSGAATSSVAAFSISLNGIVTIPTLGAASCDVKSSTAGVLSCGSDNAGSGVWPFTTGLLTYATSTQATTTPMWFKTAFYASSTAATPSYVDALTMINATTTGTEAIPNSSSQAPTGAGQIALDTTNDQLVIGDGSVTSVFDKRIRFTLTYSTSTAWAGTTTLPLFVMPQAMTINTAQCITDVGTLNTQLQYGGASTKLTMFSASTTIGVESFSSNNTPTAGATSTIAWGTPASAPTQVSCTFVATITGT